MTCALCVACTYRVFDVCVPLELWGFLCLCVVVFRGKDDRPNLFHASRRGASEVVYFVGRVGTCLHWTCELLLAYHLSLSLGHSSLFPLLPSSRCFSPPDRPHFSMSHPPCPTPGCTSPLVAGVVLDYQLKLQRFYRSRHTADIVCCAVHPLQPIVATGQVRTPSWADLALCWHCIPSLALRRVAMFAEYMKGGGRLARVRCG
jgi:hypothetical protein